METGNKKVLILALAATFAVAWLPGAPAWSSSLKISYLHNLSDFTGTVPYSSVRLYPDFNNGEMYVVSPVDVRVFNSSGMEIYRFGDDPLLGSIQDMVVDPSGNIYTLSYDYSDPKAGPRFSISWCNYRGEAKDHLRMTGVPARYSDVLPHYMFLREERFLLVDKASMKAVEIDRNGAFLKGYDLAEMIGVEEKDRPNTDLFGFCIDREGSMYFSVPVHFQVYRITREGKVSSFGKAGSAPGRFGVVSGVAVDDQGKLFVSDKRRHVVMVFDREFKFIQEFGGYGERKDNLSYPDSLCLDRAGKVYVSQVRKRGVSVFQVVPN